MRGGMGPVQPSWLRLLPTRTAITSAQLALAIGVISPGVDFVPGQSPVDAVHKRLERSRLAWLSLFVTPASTEGYELTRCQIRGCETGAGGIRFSGPAVCGFHFRARIDFPKPSFHKAKCLPQRYRCVGRVLCPALVRGTCRKIFPLILRPGFR